MKQSGLLARQKAERQELLNAGMRIEKQFMLDTLQMSLHQLGWGYKRIKELTDLWGEIYNDYHIALEGKNESDVWQERMDAQIRDIIKDQQEFFDFRSRYPDIRYHGYDKSIKGVEAIGWDIL